MREIDRRRFVSGIGAAAITGFAGCSGDGNGDTGGNGNGGNTQTENDTPTPTQSSNGSGEWPNEQEIRYVIPYGPGGTSDTMARILVPAIEDQLDAEMFIENRPGGRAMIGYTETMQADPNGYTVGAITYPSAAIRAQIGLGQDGIPYGDEIGAVTYGGAGPAIAARSEVSDWEDLQNQFSSGEYETVGLTAKGSGSHLALLVMKQRGLLDWQRVVGYGDSAPAINATVNGEVDAVITGPTGMIPMIEAGDLNPVLGMADGYPNLTEEYDAFAEMPLAKDIIDEPIPGGNDLRTIIFPPDTPMDIVEQFASATEAALNSDAVMGPAERTGLPFEYVGGPEYTNEQIDALYNIDQDIIAPLEEAIDT